jgi:hypothetical protein
MPLPFIVADIPHPITPPASPGLVVPSPTSTPPRVDGDPNPVDQPLPLGEEGAAVPSPWIDGAVGARAAAAGADPAGARAIDLILTADQQEYEVGRQIISAQGQVLAQLGNSRLASDRLWVNLDQRRLRAEGNVIVNRNQQAIAGDSLTYNLLQGAGSLSNAQGRIALTTLETDFSDLLTDSGGSVGPLNDPRQGLGSLSQITNVGDLGFSTGTSQPGPRPPTSGQLRFQAGHLAFDANGWYGEDLRVTNDPLSPPELELRGNRLRVTPLGPEEEEVCIEGPRVVFDQGLTIPLLRNCYVLQRGRLPRDAFNPLPTSIGYDGRDRDGLFIGREFQVLREGPWRLSLSPQLYLSRWLQSDSLNLVQPANFGLVGRLNGQLSPRTSLTGLFSLPGLDLGNLTERLRASLRLQQWVGDHRLSLEYTYRDRLFNGSLGFQDVQSSLGALLQSPPITLGDSQINLSYQAAGQYVTANTDQPDLLGDGTGLGLVSLFRLQGAVDLNRSFTLWQGAPQAPDQPPSPGYSPRPLVPSLSLLVGLRGIATYYSSNDLQESLEGRVGLNGQFGRLTRNYFDYTQFNLGLSSSLVGGKESPFLFDRAVDQNVLSGGILQQIYGPILVGFQTAFNLDTGQKIDTSLIVEYRRRTYGISVRYSPIQETGLVEFRLSNFDWTPPWQAGG